MSKIFAEKSDERDVEQPTRVVSVDGMLKATLAILQIVLLALTAWGITTVMDHGDRLTRVEVRQEDQKARDVSIIDSLRDVSAKQNTLLEHNSILRTEIEHLKSQIKLFTTPR
jgi:alpha-D-ribose 1-methylphosphonate 5-triphosphate diphosphatase PhnM